VSTPAMTPGVPVRRTPLTEQEQATLLGAAVAAPSLLNTQPWRFTLGPDTVAVRADPARQLRASDPAGRWLLLSCGAALLNLRVAAEHLGRMPSVRLLPDQADPRLLAVVHLGGRSAPAGMASAMFDAIPARHTNRFPFEDRALPPAVTTALVEAAALEGAQLTLLTDPAERARVTDLVAVANADADLDTAAAAEAARWAGVDPQRRDGVPGWALGPVPRDPRAAVRDLRRGAPVQGRPTAAFERAAALGVLSTARDDPTAWLRAGQALQRVLLVATVQGVVASFLNQPLEVPALRFLVRNPEHGVGYPQMLMRLGYGTVTPATPRRSLRQVTDD